MKSIKSIKREISLAERLHNHLRSRAYEKKTSSYEEAQKLLGCSFQELGKLLSLVMAECKELKEPFYPALMVGAQGIPSAGFFDQARDLGALKESSSVEDNRAFWIWQLHKMGMHEEMFYTQTSKSAWQEHRSLLELLGYTVDFKPMYPEAPNSSFLKGKKLVEVVVRAPEDPKVQEFLSQRPRVRNFLEKFDPTAEATERVRQLRRELQALALEHLHADIQSLAVKGGHVEASTLPKGEDTETASGLPS